MEMPTTPFEDLLLGSEFLPVLTSIQTRPRRAFSAAPCIHSYFTSTKVHCDCPEVNNKNLLNSDSVDASNVKKNETLPEKLECSLPSGNVDPNVLEESDKVKDVFNDNVISCVNSPSISLVDFSNSRTLSTVNDTEIPFVVEKSPNNEPIASSRKKCTSSSSSDTGKISDVSVPNSLSVSTSCTLSVLQCRKCSAAFLEAHSALAHFKLHLLIAYKLYFSIFFGVDCAASKCCNNISAKSKDSGAVLHEPSADSEEVTVPSVNNTELSESVKEKDSIESIVCSGELKKKKSVICSGEDLLDKSKCTNIEEAYSKESPSQSCKKFVHLNQVHFHCKICSFTSNKVFSLPVHMESKHLSFSRQVSLRLQAHPTQLHKEYTCGECGKKIQGTMSIIQHLLAHDSDADPYFYKINKSSDITNQSHPSINESVLSNANSSKGSLLSSGFTDLPSSLSELVNKSATPLLSENVNKNFKKNLLQDDSKKRLVDLKKWCPEMVKEGDVTKDKNVRTADVIDKTSETADSEDTSNKPSDDKLLNGDVKVSEAEEVDKAEETPKKESNLTEIKKKDIFNDEDIELVNVRWITEGLLVDNKDGEGGWKIVTSNRIVLDDPIDPLYKVDNQSCWKSNKWYKDDPKHLYKSKPHSSSWSSSRREGGKFEGSIPFIDGSSGFGNGVTNSLADIHRSIGSDDFLSSLAKDSDNVVKQETVVETSISETDAEAPEGSSTESKSEVNSLGVDMMQIEIDPLTLLANAIEEDQKTANPLIPTEHFMLGKGEPEALESNAEDSEDGVTDYSTNEGVTPDYNALDPTVHGYSTGPQNFQNVPSSPGAQMMMPDGSLLSKTQQEMMMQMANSYLDNAGVFQCDVCPKAFKYQYLLLSHRRHVHSLVSKPNSQLKRQTSHFNSHHDNSNPMLDPDTFNALLNAQNGSLDSVHPALKSKLNTGLIINGQVFCPVCGKKFVDRASLIAHSAIHMDKTTCCQSCLKEFPSKSELTMHIVKYQGTCDPSKAGIVKCATCGEQLASLSALKEHRRMVHPAPGQVMTKQEDGSKDGVGNSEFSLQSSSMSMSASHDQFQHPVNPHPRRGFQCDYCGKNFNCRSNLRDHLVVHTGEKPYPCDICGKTFSFVHNMKTHRLTHNQGRQELCPYCDKSYKSKISLYYHMKKGNCRGLSNTEVPEGFHRCTDCLQMFASEERYTSHKEKGNCHALHRCHTCGLRCSSLTRLNNHIDKGLCKKDHPKSFSSNQLALKKKRREKSLLSGNMSSYSNKHISSNSSIATDDIVCERCNYNRDCCCTFNCSACNKRVFSILAYTHHKQKTCPVVRMRKDKLRAAMLLNKKNKEENETQNKDKKKEDSCSSDDDELNNFNLSNFSSLGSSVLGYDVENTSKDDGKEASKDELKSGWLNKDIMETSHKSEDPIPIKPVTSVSTPPLIAKNLAENKSNVVLVYNKPMKPPSYSKANKTLTKLKNKAARIARQNRVVIKKSTNPPSNPSPKPVPLEKPIKKPVNRDQIDASNIITPPETNSAVNCSSTDVLSARGRRIKRPKKLEDNAYDDALAPPAKVQALSANKGEIKPSKISERNWSKSGDVTKAAVVKSLNVKTSSKSDASRVGGEVSSAQTSVSSAQTCVSSPQSSVSSPQTSVSSATVVSPDGKKTSPNKIISFTASLPSRPNQVITFKQSLPGQKIQGGRLVAVSTRAPSQPTAVSSIDANGLYSVKPQVLSQNIGQAPILVNSSNKIIVRHGSGGQATMSLLTGVRAGLPQQAVLIPTQSLILQPNTVVAGEKMTTAVVQTPPNQQ